MQRYTDINGDSGVAAYEVGASYIVVQFKDGAEYEYTSLSAGQQHVDEMARLARQGDGLNSFINRVVKKRYSRRLR
jgi:hypothetical protein